jgi:serine/threonine-protein kinase
VAYYLMTGELLFNRTSPLQMLHAHAYEPLVPLHQFEQQVPEDLQKVILKCLEKDPGRRFANITAVENALAACKCANQWSRETAEEWWRTHEKEDDKGTEVEESPEGERRTIYLSASG